MAEDDRYNDKDFVKWAHAVKKKFDYVCQLCGKRGGSMVSHHLHAWGTRPDLRYDIENGTCIHSSEHELFHTIYNFGGNTPEQFSEFKSLFQKIKQIAISNINKKEQEE